MAFAEEFHSVAKGLIEPTIQRLVMMGYDDAARLSLTVKSTVNGDQECYLVENHKVVSILRPPKTMTAFAVDYYWREIVGALQSYIAYNHSNLWC